MKLRRYIKRFFESPKVVVLMYHRIAELEADPWQLAVSPAHFEAQLKLLTKEYRVITPHQLLEQVSRKSIRKNQVCITFDDGYLDNYTTAAPLLQKYQCPATFFISTYYLENDQPYWWDVLQEIVFSSPQLPSPFTIAIGGNEVSYVLENNGKLTEEQKEKQNHWVWSDTPPTQRCALYFSLWENMRPLPQTEIEGLLVELKKMAGLAEVSLGLSRPMTVADLKDMSRQPLLQIGLHTHTHPALAYHSASVQRNELAKNRESLEKICQSSITTLSYPHGHYNEDTLAVAAELGVAAAFTTKAEKVSTQSPVHRLGRYQVQNWNKDAFAAFLKKQFGA